MEDTIPSLTDEFVVGVGVSSIRVLVGLISDVVDSVVPRDVSNLR